MQRRWRRPARRAATPRLPALGDAAEDFGVNDERRLGEQIMGEIRRDPDYLDDPVLLEYLQSLWQPLVAAARQRATSTSTPARQFAWESFLVRDRSVNAFALPGGFVGVHLGLIAMTATRDELASVLAHELTHVTQRHIARGMANQAAASLLGIAGMILAVLAASRGNNADMAQAAIAGGQAAAIQGQLNFSRDMEREADRIGYAVLGIAGFDGAGMAGDVREARPGQPAERQRRLPLPAQPPAHAGAAERSAPAPAGQQRHPRPSLTVAHAVMSARARVLMDTSVLALRKLQELPAHGRARARPTGWPRCTPARWRRACCVTTRWPNATRRRRAPAAGRAVRARARGATRAVAAGRRRPPGRR
jgi:predicted Zn-dependent protease